MFGRVLVLNMPGFCICLWFWMSLGYLYAWIIPEHSWICGNIAWMCLNLSEWFFFFSIPHCNPLFILTCGYLFQCLYKTRSFSLKDYEAVIINQSRIGTKVISKIVILLPWKVWTSLKVSPKVENHNVNPKKVLPAADFLAWFISFFYGTIFLAIESKRKTIHTIKYSKKLGYVYYVINFWEWVSWAFFTVTYFSEWVCKGKVKVV